MGIDDILDVVLEDDSTDFGGTAFNGETVKDFVESLGLDPCEVGLEELNRDLVASGIKPIGFYPNMWMDGYKRG